MKHFVFNSEKVIRVDDLESVRLAIQTVHNFITTSPKIKLRMSKNMWRELCITASVKQLTAKGTSEMPEGETEFTISGKESMERRKQLEETMKLLMPRSGTYLDVEICDEMPQRTVLSKEDPWQTNITEPIVIVYAETGKEAATIDNIQLMSG